MDLFFSILIFGIILWIWHSTGVYGGNRSVRTGWELNSRGNNVSKSKRISNRKYALSKAKPFLKAYKEIMGEHSLANENCNVSLIIEKDNKKKIVCISKILVNNNKRRIITISVNETLADYYPYPADYVIDNMWDILCTTFSYTTMYENIYEAAENMMLKIQESSISVKSQGTNTQQVYDSVSNTNIRTNNLININVATEAELLALPGVNIVIAKKAIKYVEKTGGFKSVDEFILKMKIKDTFADQIKNVTCVSLDNSKVEKPKEQKNQENTSENYIPHSQSERIIDL